MKKIDEIKNNPFVKIFDEMNDNGDIGLMGFYKSRMQFIFSNQYGWEHLSVSFPNRCPSWEEMCEVKDLFWNKDECCVQYHPAESEYVNCHPYCLHIWKPLGKHLPTPPKIMVGTNKGECVKSIQESIDKLRAVAK